MLQGSLSGDSQRIRQFRNGLILRYLGSIYHSGCHISGIHQPCFAIPGEFLPLILYQNPTKSLNQTDERGESQKL
ncbi:hypothetical protein BH09BAC4_BH09BAC4_42060 [soil metagenome]